MDPLRPRASAVAVAGSRIVRVGSDEEVRRLATRAARIIDAGGKLVLPGFQDTHIHLQDSGTDRELFDDLEDAATVDELQQRLRQFANKTGSDGWIKGVGWYSGIF